MSERTIVFDLDGTLVDTAPDLAATMNALLIRHGRAALPAGDVRQLVGRGARALMARAFARTGKPATEPQLDDLYTEFLAHYDGHLIDNSAPFPGVTAALDRLARRGAVLAVCTNKPEAPARKLLGLLGLEPYFTAVLGGDSLAVRKPDPDHVWQTIARAGGRREAALLVGDSVNDLEAARAALVPMIAVSFGYSDPPIATHGPDALINHFDELDAAIGRF